MKPELYETIVKLTGNKNEVNLRQFQQEFFKSSRSEDIKKASKLGFF
jgi:hypothetical protein